MSQIDRLAALEAEVKELKEKINQKQNSRFGTFILIFITSFFTTLLLGVIYILLGGK